jgi:galactokinase
MGGIADYSGSLVLEMPIREAVLCALQKDDSKLLKIVSVAEKHDRSHSFEMPLSDLFSDGAPVSYETARKYFRRDKKDQWAAYAAGVFLVLMRELSCSFSAAKLTGARIFIDSRVPIGKGVSSSAAVEVAVMNAVCVAYEIKAEPRELAMLCQKAENLIVGAPCGVMDQISSNCGEAGKLLSLLCQPAQLNDPIEIPPEIEFWGIDSGIRHSVGAGDYGLVRTGAFMGYRIIGETVGLQIGKMERAGLVEMYDERWGGYLANVSAGEFESSLKKFVRESYTGAEFLRSYHGITDPVTRIDPEKTYAVLQPTAHAIYENERAHRFAELLGAAMTEDVLKEMGELMYASHESYSACGLGSDGTDLLVKLVKENARDFGGLYGAKITGGGSGGTVAVLGEKSAGAQIEKIAEKYEKGTGYRPYIFSGSSMGAAAFGYLVLGN